MFGSEALVSEMGLTARYSLLWVSWADLMDRDDEVFYDSTLDNVG